MNPFPIVKCARGRLLISPVHLQATPTNQSLGSLDVPIPIDDLDKQIDTATSGFDGPLNNMQSTLTLTPEDIQVIRGQLSMEAISGISFVFFSPAWYAIISLILALVLGAPFKAIPSRMHKTGDCCWWVGFTFLSIWIVYSSIICAFVGIPGVVLYDLCNFLPPPGGSSIKVVNAIRR